ncbi:hypothetical protein FACS1894211_02460 [Clostridia bacterium]|nr:hypothetical protein FACS1894211_02460 [Clostridia bacterium]
MNNSLEYGAKLYDDRVTFCTHRGAVKNFKKQISDTQYVDKRTGEVFEYTFKDCEKRIKNYEKGLCRSIDTVKEISKRNVFQWFVTMTFNKMYVDRHDFLSVYIAYRNIMKRLKYAFGILSFLCVPEFHKDGAIHCHLLINFKTKPKLCSIGMRDGHRAYRLYKNPKTEKFPFWVGDCFLDFSPVIKNNTYYLIKYMSKGHTFPFVRRFFCSRGLNRLTVDDTIDVDFGGGLESSHLVDRAVFRHVKRHLSANGFFVNYDNGGDRYSVVYSVSGGAGGEAPPPDLSCVNIIDENRKTLLSVWAWLTSLFRMCEKIIALSRINKAFERREYNKLMWRLVNYAKIADKQLSF